VSCTSLMLFDEIASFAARQSIQFPSTATWSSINNFESKIFLSVSKLHSNLEELEINTVLSNIIQAPDVKVLETIWADVEDSIKSVSYLHCYRFLHTLY
jgi:hypothetical protein